MADSLKSNDPRGKLLEAIQDRFASRCQLSEAWQVYPGLVMGHGVVTSTGEKVAFQSATGVSQSALIRIRHESAALRSIQSDFVARHIDACFDDDAAVVVDAYPGDRHLGEHVHQNKLSCREAIQLGICIFRSLSELHSVGIQHQDVRPDNFCFREDGGLHLVRRNLIPQADSDMSDAERILRASYLSPEQAGSIERDVAAPADLYSAGAILYFMLTGNPPYVRNDVSSTLLAHMTAPLPGLHGVLEGMPRAMEKIVHRLLAKDPGNRYQTADAVLFDLDRLASELDRGVEDPDIVIGSQDDRSTLIEPSFVGRRDELQELDRQLERSLAGEPSLVLLEGLSGSGKSRLLLEFYQHAISREFQLFRGAGSTDSARQALSLLNGVVDDFISASTGDSRLVNEFLEQFDGDLGCLVSILPKLASVLPVPADSLQGPELFAENRQLRTLSSFLYALGSQSNPALILLDDCQWADDLTYKLLKRLTLEATLDQSRPVMFLLACRTEEVGENHALRELRTTGHIELSDLSDDEVTLLAESMAGNLPAAAIQMIVDAAGGSPFMASAVVRGLVESDALTRSDSGWVIDEVAFADCQSSNYAGEFLKRRLDLLSQPTLELLMTGAVLGKEFDFAEAIFLSGQDPTSSLSWLDEARQRHMLWIRSDVGHGVFSHDKIRETLLQRIPPDELKLVHRRAAEFLAEQEQDHASRIAFHYDAAGELELALPFALIAAEDARRKTFLDVAKSLYLIAERAAENQDAGTRLRISEGLGDVHMLIGEYDAAEERFHECKNLADGKLDEARANHRLAEVARKRGDLEKAIVEFEAGLRTLGAPVPDMSWKFVVGVFAEVVLQVLTTMFPSVLLHRKGRKPNESEQLTMSLLSGVTHAYWYVRGKRETLWSHFRNLNLAERFHPSAQLATVYSEHAPTMCLLRLFGRAERYAKKSLEIHRDAGNQWGEGQAQCFLACAYYAASRFDEAISTARESVRLLERAGDYWYVHIARFQLAASMLHLGRFRDALEACKINHASGLAIGDEQTTGVITDLWAQASGGYVPDDIMQVELVRDRIDMQARCHVLMAKGIIELKASRIDEALEALDEGIRVINEAGVSNCYLVPVYYLKTHCLRRKAEMLDSPLDGAKRIRTLKQAFSSGIRAWFESWLSSNELPKIYRELALLRMMDGRARQARWLLKRSIRSAKRMHCEFEYAESLRILGELGVKFGWRGAEDDLEKATALLNRITVESGVEHARAEKESTKITLSLADRFDTILEVGRRITSALVEKDVYEQTRLATLRLLRCEDCVIVKANGSDYSIVAGEQIELDRQALRAATDLGRASAKVFAETRQDNVATQADQQGSILCVPIIVLGEVKASIYATHETVRDLFGPTEERLADFISAIAGASLENAQQYDELQALNLTLEDRVAERTEAAESRALQLAASNRELERTAEDLRSTEEQLLEAIKEANSANEAKSQFLATMSHEIRTPMNGILGMTDLLLRSSVTHQQESCLKVVKQSGATLLTLLNDILDLSKIEAGKMELESIEFDIREVVENSVRLIAAAAFKKNLDVICEIDNNLPQLAIGDPGRIRQILTNLIGNAVKFTSEGQIHVSVRPVDGGVEFNVTDTGIGISTDKQGLIFDAFKQSDSSTTRQFGGTGLGLSICRTLVEMMGGRIAVESEPGVGSRFYFHVPFEEMKASQFAFSVDELRGLVAAVVCRNPTARRARSLMMECLGLSVMSFDSVKELQDDLDCFDVVLIEEHDVDAWKQFKLTKSRVLVLSQTISPLTDDLLQVTTPPVLDELGNAIQILTGVKSGNRSSAKPSVDAVDTGCRILLADDSIVNQEVAAGLLGHAGHTVVVANNGQEAFDAFDEQEFDLILMDIEMPEVDGLEATRMIRAHERGATIPVVAMSAHAILEKEEACYDAGIDSYIAKPFDPDQLLNTISELVSRKSATQGLRDDS